MSTTTTWRHLVDGVEPVELHVRPDGLPAGVYASLAEALSWLALGRAIPSSVWRRAQGLEAAVNELSRPIAPESVIRSDIALYAGGPMWVTREYDKWSWRRLRGRDERSQSPDETLKDAWAALLCLVATLKGRGSEVTPEDALGAAMCACREAEEQLFSQIREGKLICQARDVDGDNPVVWRDLPADLFFHDISASLAHDDLEPGGMDEDIGSAIRRWCDPRVRVDHLANAFSPLESASLGPSAVSDRSEKQSAGSIEEVRVWYRKRVTAHNPRLPPPSREDDIKAAAIDFNVKGLKELVRKARKHEAPEAWRRAGARGRKRAAAGEKAKFEK